jgi:FkbM family methyltransferase
MRIIRKIKGIFRKTGLEKYLNNKEIKRLRSLDRYTYAQTNLFGRAFKIVDACTFLSSLSEIFLQEIYKFNTDEKNINIIDCGANIGLASLYFKMIYPDSNIIAFEADPTIFCFMKENLINQGYVNILCKNEAISDKDGYVNFHLEGGHSGMIVNEDVSEKVVKVKSTRLKNILSGFNIITFLKIDIEGHEKYVIPDIAEELFRVKFLFLEYHSFIDDHQYLEEILAIISKSGFRYYIKESCNKTSPFLKKEIFLKMDLILNIFCYKS